MADHGHSATAVPLRTRPAGRFRAIIDAARRRARRRRLVYLAAGLPAVAVVLLALPSGGGPSTQGVDGGSSRGDQCQRGCSDRAQASRRDAANKSAEMDAAIRRALKTQPISVSHGESVYIDPASGLTPHDVALGAAYYDDPR